MEEKMESIEKIVPISSWQTIHNVVSPLITSEDKVENLLKLTNIVKLKEFSNVIVFNHDPGLSFQAYEEVSKIYQEFTTWLLGQFYYLLSVDRTTR